MSIYKKLIDFQKDIPSVDLDGEVSYNRTKFKYATLGNIIDKIRPTLVEKGLGFYQSIEDESVITVIFDDKDTIKSSKKLPNITNPQDLGKWITYIKRYQLAAMLGIVAEEDKDGSISQKTETQKEKDSRVEMETVKSFIEKAKSVPQLVKLENNLDENGKMSPEYLSLIESAKQKLIDQEMNK